MTTEDKQENTIVTNAMRAFGCLTTAKSVMEVYATFGILLGKFCEFASMMKDKANIKVEEVSEDSECESEGPEPSEMGKGSN